MKYREDKKFTCSSAKTVLLEDELEEAIQSEDRLRMAEHECSAQISSRVWLSIATSTLPKEYPQRISTSCIRVR